MNQIVHEGRRVGILIFIWSSIVGVGGVGIELVKSYVIHHIYLVINSIFIYVVGVGVVIVVIVVIVVVVVGAAAHIANQPFLRPGIFCAYCSFLYINIIPQMYSTKHYCSLRITSTNG